ncbi:MAG: acyl-CoA thioesterase [Acidiferrobacterales bacterium]
MNPLSENIQPVLRVVPRPRDTNTAGDIFGGWIMSHVDIAGAVVATQRARGRVVTVAVNEFQFKKPVFLGDIVSFYAEIKKTGTTSVTVDVTVYAERGLRSGKFGECDKVTEALLTYVALDENHKPRPLPATED